MLDFIPTSKVCLFSQPQEILVLSGYIVSFKKINIKTRQIENVRK